MSRTIVVAPRIATGRRIAVGRAIPTSRSLYCGWLLDEQFLRDVVAGSLNGLASNPGPGGTNVVTDTNNKLSFLAGKARFATGGVGIGNPGLWKSLAFTARGGLALFATVVSTLGSIQVGWDSNQAGSIQDRVVIFASSVRVGAESTADTASLGVLVSGIAYKVCSMFMAPGTQYFIKGGIYKDWTRLAALVVAATGQYPAIGAGGATLTGTVTPLRAIQLGYPFETNYDSALYNSASPVSGDTQVSNADGTHSLTWTPVAGETFEFSIRRTDDNNRWILRASQTGATVKLIEKVAGVETERTSDAQSFAAGVAKVMWLVAFGNSIYFRVGNGGVDNVYTSASFNNTATGTKVAGFATGANFSFWERTLTGAARAAMDAVYP